MKFDNGRELNDIIKIASKNDECLLLAFKKNWWFLKPINGIAQNMWVLSSSIPELPSIAGTDKFDLFYRYKDEELGITREGLALVSLQEVLKEDDDKLPEFASLKPEANDLKIEPLGLMRLRVVKPQQLPLYLENVREKGEEVLKML